MNEAEKKIVEKILESKKYKNLDEKLVTSMVAEFSKKYKSKVVEQEVKNKLHQIWGTYFASLPDYNKLFEKLTAGQVAIADILRLHISTAERISFFEKMYIDIFEKIGSVKSILDIGSGFNPLNFQLMNIDLNGEYYVIDIDKKEIEFLEKTLNNKDIFPNKNVNFILDCMSALEIDFVNLQKFDVIFLLKLLQNLEQQKKGSGVEILLNSINNAKFVIVSFPTKSVGGKNKNMGENYAIWFEDILSQKNIQSEKLFYENELVYICKGQNK